MQSKISSHGCMKVPRVFISYCWSSPAHETWVLDLAHHLSTDGVDVVLDKWSLKPGQEKYSFMEQMVNDTTVSKVLIICDKGYREKANARKGGVGTESQIISKEIYEQVSQDKFIPIIAERDEKGEACLPTFVSTRIYVDMSQPERYPAAYEELVRTIFDQPKHRRPVIGTPPAYVATPDVVQSRTAALARLAVTTIEGGDRTSMGHVRKFLNQTVVILKELYITSLEQGVPPDDLVLQRLEAFRPVRDQFISVVESLLLFQSGPASTMELRKFFEDALQAKYPQFEGTSYVFAADATSLAVHELFLYTVALLLSNERYDDLGSMLAYEFYREKNGQAKFVGYRGFNSYSRCLEVDRKNRLQIRLISITADIFRQRADNSLMNFSALMNADLILFARSLMDIDSFGEPWLGTCMLFAENSGPPRIFQRMISKAFVAETKSLFKLSDGTDFAVRATQAMQLNPHLWSRYQFLSLQELFNLEKIGSLQ